MCRKDNNKNLCQVDDKHLLKMMYRKNKNKNLCQVRNMPKSGIYATGS